MKYQKPNIVGVDVPIQKLQNYLYLKLEAMGIVNFDMYARCYVVENDSGKVPVWIYNNKEQEEVLFNDKRNLTAFFLTNNTIKINDVASTTTSLIFQLKLNKVFPSINDRTDENFINIMMGLFNNYPINLKLSQITKGIDNVYREFSKKHISNVDTINYFVCRFDFETTYTYNNLCNI